jgi:glycosyltransferase involved in cell wall biosynthesis
LLPLLRDKGFDVHVACLDDRGPLFETLRDTGVGVHFIGRRHAADPAAAMRIRALIMRLGVGILNTHALSAGLWGRLAAAATVPRPLTVSTFHAVAGWQQPMKQGVLNRLLLPWTDAVVAVSDAVRESLVERGIPRTRTRVIYNGVDTDRFAPAPDRRAARAGLGLPAGSFTVGLVARSSAEKGGDHWLRAIRLLRTCIGECRGVMVGDGPELPAWKRLAEDLGIGDIVTFAGAQVRVEEWIAALDVLVCPSLQEAFGIAALEGQAAGVPVVASRIGGLAEVLHDGEDALLVPAADHVAIYAAIARLRASPALAGAIAAAGRRNARRFTTGRAAAEYASLYRELAERGPGRLETENYSRPIQT